MAFAAVQLFVASLLIVAGDRPDETGTLSNPLHSNTRASVYVTRLHRYDHSGLAAMLEAEALWKMAQDRNPNGVKHRHISRRGKPHFVQLSHRQVQALQEHHRIILAQEEGRGGDSEATSPLLRTARKHEQVPQSLVAARSVTGLKRLDSQYVGSVGVGTTFQDCKKRTSLMSLPKPGEASSAVQHTSCRERSQSDVWVVFDTGSTNIWIDSDLCTEGACAKADRHRYNHTLSATYKVPEHGVDLKIEFGTGKVSGPQAVDDFHVGPFTVKQQTFGMIQVEEGSVFEDVALEGILGLAFPTMSAGGVAPFFDNIVKQKCLEKNQFSFYFSLNNPAANAVFWGGADPEFYTGKMEFFKVTDPYYWSIDLVSFQIGGQEFLGEKTMGGGTDFEQATPKAIIDTGTTYFTAYSGLFEKVLGNLTSMPCKNVTDQTHPPLTYRLRTTEGRTADYVLHHGEYLTESTGRDDDSNWCSAAFMKINIPKEHAPAMVLGEVFLRHFYSTFDRGNGQPGSARVGFARSRHDDSVVDRLQDLTRGTPIYATRKKRI